MANQNANFAWMNLGNRKFSRSLIPVSCFNSILETTKWWFKSKQTQTGDVIVLNDEDVGPKGLKRFFEAEMRETPKPCFKLKSTRIAPNPLIGTSLVFASQSVIYLISAATR